MSMKYIVNRSLEKFDTDFAEIMEDMKNIDEISFDKTQQYINFLDNNIAFIRSLPIGYSSTPITEHISGYIVQMNVMWKYLIEHSAKMAGK